MSRYEKVVIITRVPISKHEIEIFGVENFLNRGYTVDLWDLSSIFNKKFEKEVNNYDSADHFLNTTIKSYNTKEDVFFEVNNISNKVLFVIHITISYDSLWLYRLISKKTVDYTVCNLFSFPSVAIGDKLSIDKRININLIKDMIKNLKFKGIVNKFMAKYPRFSYKCLGIRPASYFVVGGSTTLEPNNYCIDESTIICRTHSFDYDKYLEEMEKNTEFCDLNKKYAVFLDQFYPFHPDKLYFGISNVEPSKYYSSLSSFFDHLTSKYGVEIIIAAHPRSYYERMPDYFNGRKVIKGHTSGLVKNSEFVIIHDSTAVNYAILYKKPILFTRTIDMTDYEKNKYITFLADLFNQKVICMDKFEDCEISRSLKVNEGRYHDYLIKYIKTDESPEKYIWDIFIDCLDIENK